MKRPKLEESWTYLWKGCYYYDCSEVFNDPQVLGYHWAYQVRQQHTLQMVAAAAPPPATVLDLAAAQGNFSLTLAELGYDVTWNDLRPELIDYVRLKYERGSIRYVAGDIFDLSLPERFDIVLAGEVIEHVAHPDRLLKKMASFVKPGGHMVLTTPNNAYFRHRRPRFSECQDPAVYEARQYMPDVEGHIFLFDLDELCLLSGNAGLVLCQSRHHTNFLTNGHIKTASLLRWLPAGAVRGFEKLTSHLPEPIKRTLTSGVSLLLQNPRQERLPRESTASASQMVYSHAG